MLAVIRDLTSPDSLPSRSQLDERLSRLEGAYGPDAVMRLLQDHPMDATAATRLFAAGPSEAPASSFAARLRSVFRTN